MLTAAGRCYHDPRGWAIASAPCYFRRLSLENPINLDRLKVIPLGGLGEIGMNCLALEQDGRRLVIDCGLAFDDRGIGIDTVHADFGWLHEAPDRLEAIVLTHGHEDHVGAVPHLLEGCRAPVYGPPYALAVLRERLAQTPDLGFEPQLHPIAPGDRVRLGPFTIEPYRVTHSMPDSTGLIVRTSAGVIVHSGDFKIEDDPTDGEGFDWERLERLRDEEGVRLLMSDSTNALEPGSTGTERSTAERLSAIVGQAQARVVVTIFASNVHRLRSLAQIAKRSGRKLCLLGRSLNTHARIASEQGYLPDLSDVLIPPRLAAKMARDQILVLATGTQGEPAAAFARLAKGEHPDLTLEQGDLVIHSARIIPGCDKQVFPLFNALARRQIEVIWKHSDPAVHVSGHAHRDEQRRLIEALRPAAFVPLHGTYLHMRRHATLARECGVHDVVVIENGAVLEVGSERLAVNGRVPTGRVHREGGRPVDLRVLHDRALLAELGVAVVTAIVDASGRPSAPIDVLTRGVVHEEENQTLLDEACDYVFEALLTARYLVERPEEEDVEQIAQRALKRFFAKRSRKKPLCYAVVMRSS